MNTKILIYNVNVINSTLNSLDAIKHHSFLATIDNDFQKFLFVYSMLKLVNISESELTSAMVLEHIIN